MSEETNWLERIHEALDEIRNVRTGLITSARAAARLYGANSPMVRDMDVWAYELAEAASRIDAALNDHVATDFRESQRQIGETLKTILDACERKETP